MSKFDPKRPHGIIYGFGDARYEQDGKHFDSEGNEVGGEKPAEKPAPKVLKGKPRVVTEDVTDGAAASSAPKAPDQVAKQLAE